MSPEITTTMKFTISSTALLKQVTHLQSIITRSGTLPILDNLLFEVDGKRAAITASDLETIVTTTIPVETKNKGAITIPYRLLAKALRYMKDQHLTFSVDKGGRVTISGDGGTYEIAGVDAGQFPKTPATVKPSAFSIPASALSAGVSKSFWAVGNDDLRPVMSGVLFDMGKKEVKFVATDAHHLVVHTYTKAKNIVPRSFIVPKKTLRMLGKYLRATSGDVSMLVGETHAQFAFDNITITCHLVDGKYPNYEAVLPTEHTTQVTANRFHLLSSIRRVNVFSNNTTREVRLTVDKDGVSLTAKDYDFNSAANERMACAVSGNPLTIGFNGSRLITVLENMTCENVVLRMSKPNRAATFEPAEVSDSEKCLVLLMPVLLNN